MWVQPPPPPPVHVIYYAIITKTDFQVAINLTHSFASLSKLKVYAPSLFMSALAVTHTCALYVCVSVINAIIYILLYM